MDEPPQSWVVCRYRDPDESEPCTTDVARRNPSRSVVQRVLRGDHLKTFLARLVDEHGGLPAPTLKAVRPHVLPGSPSATTAPDRALRTTLHPSCCRRPGLWWASTTSKSHVDIQN